MPLDIISFLEARKAQKAAEQAALNPNRGVAQMGDSRMEYVKNNLEDRTVPAYSTRQNGLQGYLKSVMRGRVEVPLSLNVSHAGDTTETIEGQIPAMLASDSGTVLLLGGTNDRTFGRTLGWTFERTRDSLSRSINAVLSSGRNLVLIAELPRGEPGTFANRRLSGQNLEDHYRIRQWCLSLAGTHRRLAVVDAWPEFADPTSTTGDAKAGYLIDGLHLSAFGNYRLAEMIRPALERFYPAHNVLVAQNGDRYSATNSTGNLVSNGMMGGSAGTLSGGATGVAPDGWSLIGTAGATVVGSKYDATTFQIDVSGTPTGTTINLQQSVTLANVSAGDILQATADIEIVSVTQPYRAVQSGLLLSGASTVTAYELIDMNLPLQFAWSGIHRGEAVPVPPSPTLVRAVVSIIPVQSAAAGITIRVRSFSVRKVPA